MGACVILRSRRFIMVRPFKFAIGCLLVAALGSKSPAVWPPSTSLQEEAAPKPAPAEDFSATSERVQQLVDKLEADERRLEKLLLELEARTKKTEKEEHPK